MAELPGYVDTLLALREEYKDRINILIGLEVEYTLKYFDPLISQLQKYPVDYIGRTDLIDRNLQRLMAALERD